MECQLSGSNTKNVKRAASEGRPYKYAKPKEGDVKSPLQMLITAFWVAREQAATLREPVGVAAWRELAKWAAARVAALLE